MDKDNTARTAQRASSRETIVWRSTIAKASARIYGEALIEACQQVGADPRRALTDADEFPKLRKISEVEYSIGWLNGCAEAHEIEVTAFWDRLLPTLRGRKP